MKLASGNQLLRAAVVGVGFVGPLHVDAIRRGGYAEVVALVGNNPERTQASARSLGVPAAPTNLADVLADPGVDVVHVCTPNASHVAIATAAIEAGKHVVVEKPVATSTDDAWALAELAASRGRHAAVAFTYRGYPMVRRARRIVADGDFGEVRLIHGAYLQDWLLEPSDYNWRVDPAAGGPSRTLADIGSHWFDTVEFVSGERVVAVLADLATFIPMRRRRAAAGPAVQTFRTRLAEDEQNEEAVEVTSEDAATLLVRFGNGAIGSCIVSQISPGHRNDFSIQLTGAHRSLSWQQERPDHLAIGSRTGGIVDLPREPDAQGEHPGTPSLPAGHPEGWGEALRDMLRPFYRAIAQGDPPQSPGAEDAPYPTLVDGARAVAFVEAALESDQTGQWVELPRAPLPIR